MLYDYLAWRQETFSIRTLYKLASTVGGGLAGGGRCSAASTITIADSNCASSSCLVMMIGWLID